MRPLLRSVRCRYLRYDQCLRQGLKPTSRLSNDCSHFVYSSILPTIQVSRYRTVFSTGREDQGYGQSVDEGGPTIYALSTASGRAAIAVIRISGPRCVEVCHIFFANVQSAK